MPATWFQRSSGFLAGMSLFVLPAAYMLHRTPAALPAGHHDYSRSPNEEREHIFRIVAFGSSSTRGYGATSEAATYPARLEALLARRRPGEIAVEVVNRGINGEDIEGMAKRLDDDILARKPDLVIWQIGGNDALHAISLTRFNDILRDGIARLRAAGTGVILMDPQWTPKAGSIEVFAKYIAAVLAMGREQSVPVIDRFDMMQRWMRDGIATQQDLIGPDGLHSTDRGYALLAQAVVEAVKAQSPDLRPTLRASAHSTTTQ